MAITATPGAADADVFLTLAEADAYHSEDQIHTNATWSARTDAEKEAALKLATRVLTGLDYVGYRGTASQALAWPRLGATVDGRLISSAVVPAEVKWATAELAEWMAAGDRSAPSPGNKIGMVKVGEIEIDFRRSAGGILQDLPDTVVRYLDGFLSGGLRGGNAQVVV